MSLSLESPLDLSPLRIVEEEATFSSSTSGSATFSSSTSLDSRQSKHGEERLQPLGFADEIMTEDHSQAIPDNPFDSPESRPLFEAIDRLQSCGVSQHIEIPQLVIVGGQSCGKSSLVQSLTDIPLPVGTGCCTRFATRIVSKRTGSNTTPQFKITIVEPEFKFSGFEYDHDDASAGYTAFERVGETLTYDEFTEIIEDVSSNYMGIKPGTGPGKKNFATQVLRVELSGPTRSHFSILDIPGYVASPVNINESEMRGIQDMMVQYMKQPENILICVADAVSDLEGHAVHHLCSQSVSMDRFVGVFTKCDMVHSEDQVIKNATTANGGNWFVVRNRHRKDPKSLELSVAEARLFNKSPWTAIPETRRGTARLRHYLSNVLAGRIRKSFPQMQDRLRELLSRAKAGRDALGDPRTTIRDHQRFLRGIVSVYESLADKSLSSPWLLQDKVMRVRGEVKQLNDEFAQKMLDRGRKYPFETLTAPSPLPKSKPGAIVSVSTPPSTPPSQPTAGACAGPGDAKVKTIFDEIRSQLELFQSTQLPGLVNPEIVPVLYEKQIANWAQLTADHLEAVCLVVGGASRSMLIAVCPQGMQDLFQQLHEELGRRYDATRAQAREAAEAYCAKQHQYPLQTTDAAFYHELQRRRMIRWQRSLERVLKKYGETLPIHDAMSLYEFLNPSVEQNIVNEIHDVLAVYYEISIGPFVRHITNTVVEDFVSNPEGPLKGLSRAWIEGLDDDKIERLACEDAEAVAQRKYLDGHIKRLEEAHEIAEKAWAVRVG
ncbi:uncharacterized protein J7T54_004112 [Emericellopsis cladophorae]|uniref:GED domain-containing protein n=1 Tax=Emericellopsis cladophorae TaxID=2686198 RepID=A0A9Q0B8Z4_9HYPO|nr:uncharacterized protein J7T54_004112 [Emericellopsis cladophorae]KAI6778217.1 hypothetical protein J7T54_004112 [Emericellopsis cladophorae]